MNILKETFETINVYPIDTMTIAKEMTRKEHESGRLKTEEKLIIHNKLGIVRLPKFAIIDDEAVGSELRKEEDEFNILLYVEIDKGEFGSFEVIPRFEITVSIRNLDEGGLLKEPISLRNFMSDYYQRNSRIRDNEKTWLEYFNGD